MDENQGLVRKKDTSGKLTMAEVFVSSSETTRLVQAALRAGEIRKIGPRLYTSNLRDNPKEIVQRNLWRVVSLIAPGTVISFRTGLEMQPSPDGTVFLTGKGRHQIRLPGVQLRISKGLGPLPNDTPLMGIFIASRPRALLESLKPSREGISVPRGLPRERIEQFLETELRSGGETKLNAIRDGARSIAKDLQAEEEFDVLYSIIGTLLGSRKDPLLAPVALARAAGEPYDPARLELFQLLHGTLSRASVPNRPHVLPKDNEFSVISFFDAYFSNYIEGTQFEVDEARGIVFHGKIPRARPEDARDVLGTYRVVGSRDFMGRSVLDFSDYAAFEAALRAAHAEIMSGRPEKRPGEFKEVQNRAGDTRFVAPEMVPGTLKQGFEITRGLPEPFQRAAAVMFVLSEVHPFDDGNGRVARAFMNAELVSRGQYRILIPTVFRDEYLTGLRTLTRQSHPDVYIQVLDYAQEFTSRVDFSDFEMAEDTMRASNAFEDPRPDIRLRLPAQNASVT